MQKRILKVMLVLYYSLLVFTGFSQSGFNEIKEMELYTSKRSIVNGTPWYKANVYKGHQFFGSEYGKIGEILYQGKWYTDILMNYNILENEILIIDENKENTRWIKLNKKFIDSFSFIDKENQKKSSFVYTELEENAGKDFYEIVYAGTVSFYIKHKKSVRKQIENNYKGVLYPNNQLYLKKDGQIFHFYSKSKLLDVLGNKKVLRSYISKTRLKINKKNTEDIAALLVYYDGIKTKN